MTLIHESKALRFAVGATWPGASARVYSGGVDGPRTRSCSRTA